MPTEREELKEILIQMGKMKQYLTENFGKPITVSGIQVYAEMEYGILDVLNPLEEWEYE